ncbi:MAG: ABC transporter ATP-binding protein [Firmicutes bacterium]|jgi:osmoprotectant transport system ATP-binding protein|nr:ABC transporter ATP-binding protein [Bacillota bacterium]
MNIIDFRNVSKSYGENQVITDLNLRVNNGECIALIGPSGCGKTTMLKMINSMIEDYEGEIYYKGEELRKWDKISLRRSIGYVIQNIGLFPHKKIIDNISYVLEIKKVDKKEREAKAKELIEMVGLDESYLSKYPRELSGGEKQRIGVARALAGNPDMVLMDEPFGAVDEITRKILQDEIIRIQKKLKKTILFVTHDIDEAFKIGDRIILFNEGKIVQDGSKEDMLFNPENEFVSKFFGLKNFTSYLSQTNISEFVQPKGNREFTHMISNDMSIMDGIRSVFENGVDEVGIQDDNGNIVGSFSIESLRDQFNKI